MAIVPDSQNSSEIYHCLHVSEISLTVMLSKQTERYGAYSIGIVFLSVYLLFNLNFYMYWYLH